jgi:F-type H+-transporting ATPase subunit b
MLGDQLIAHHPALAFLIQVVNFAILAGALFHFLKKPFKGYLAKRHDTVKERIEEAERLLKEAQQAKALYAEKLAKLPEEIEAFRAIVLKEAEAEKTKLLAEAQELASRIREQARLAYEQELKEALSQVRAEVASHTINAAEEVVRGRFTKEDHDRMVEDFIKNVGSVT